MQNKPLGALIWVTLALLVVWLATMIFMNVTRGLITTFEQALAFASERHWLYYQLNYVNASIFSMLNMAIYAGLYGLLRDKHPSAAAIAFAFVPIYGVFALGSYLAQLILVPRLLELHALPAYQNTADLLLRQTLQMAPESALIYFDQFSHVASGIAALIFGVALYQQGRPFRLAGALLALSGATAPFIALGIFANIPPQVEWASMLGGVLAMVAYVPLGWALWHDDTAVETHRVAPGIG
jgi:hypothetical protein